MFLIDRLLSVSESHSVGAAKDHLHHFRLPTKDRGLKQQTLDISLSQFWRLGCPGSRCQCGWVLGKASSGFINVCFLAGLPWWLNDKKSACQCRRLGFNPWVRKIPWRRNVNPLQYSCLGNPMDRGIWQAPVHGVTKSQTQLSN